MQRHIELLIGRLATDEDFRDAFQREPEKTLADAAAWGCTPVTTNRPVFDAVLGPPRGRDALDAPDADVAAALRDGLDAPAPAPRWADIDRRYGVAVRSAAWEAWLTREGLV